MILKCEVCGKLANHVFASCLGPISHAYCVECIQAGREVWTTLVGGLFSLTRETVGEWIKPIIKATCEFYGKTEDDLWRDIEDYNKSFDEYMKQKEKKEWDGNESN